MRNASAIHLKQIVFVLLLSTSLTFQSCMSTRLVTEADCDTFVNNPTQRKTTWSFFWGMMRPTDIDPKCESSALNGVETKTNLGYILLSAVTLGIVVPQEVEWCCKPINPDTETIGSNQ